MADDLPGWLASATVVDDTDDTDDHDAATGPSRGAATAHVVRLRTASGTAIRKQLRPLTSGRHAPQADDPRHWAFWRREAEAYRSGLLPQGPGLRAPTCFAVVADTLFLEDVPGPPPPVHRAAAALARWHVAFDPALDRPWLAVDQLGRRLAAGELDWTAVDKDRRAVQLWSQRTAFLEQLAALPKVLSHGDFCLANLATDGDDTVAFDWATLGWEPVGFDLAHLALSALVDPTPAYRSATPRPGDADLAERGFRAALAVIGASRVHWMATNGIDVPDGYVDFLWEHRPAAP